MAMYSPVQPERQAAHSALCFRGESQFWQTAGTAGWQNGPREKRLPQEPFNTGRLQRLRERAGNDVLLLLFGQ